MIMLGRHKHELPLCMDASDRFLTASKPGSRVCTSPSHLHLIHVSNMIDLPLISFQILHLLIAVFSLVLDAVCDRFSHDIFLATHAYHYDMWLRIWSNTVTEISSGSNPRL